MHFLSLYKNVDHVLKNVHLVFDFLIKHLINVKNMYRKNVDSALKNLVFKNVNQAFKTVKMCIQNGDHVLKN